MADSALHRCGIAQIPALVRVAFAIPTDTLWVYLIGMAFSLVGLWRVAPSRRTLARDQAAIRSAGSSLDLTQALMTERSRPVGGST